MEVKNKVYPSKDQMRGFFGTTNDNEPIYMVNLLKFKDKAEYKYGRKTNLTGREAYKIYAEFVKNHLQNIGGDLILHTDVTRMAVGEVEELKSIIIIFHLYYIYYYFTEIKNFSNMVFYFFNF